MTSQYIIVQQRQLAFIILTNIGQSFPTYDSPNQMKPTTFEPWSAGWLMTPCPTPVSEASYLPWGRRLPLDQTLRPRYYLPVAKPDAPVGTEETVWKRGAPHFLNILETFGGLCLCH